MIFTSRQSKADAFRRIKAAVSYGDSDGDIRDSVAAGARPIRILRAPNSANHDLSTMEASARRCLPAQSTTKQSVCGMVKRLSRRRHK